MIQSTPGGLVEALPSDTESENVTISIDQCSEIMTYDDLARGMISVAEDRGEWEGKDVGFVVAPENPAVKKRIAWNFVACMLPGLVYTYAPWVYALVHRS